MSMLAAGIVLFNPEISRLLDNMSHIVNQVEALIIVDNGSSDIDSIKSAILGLKATNDNVFFIENEHNEGIAAAMNTICSKALSIGAEWVITLDQDSVCPDNMVTEYKNHIDDHSIGMICPSVVDVNFSSICSTTNEDKFVGECISSGSMISLSAWEEVGGFWDELFIDMVDIDMCWSLTTAGYKILQLGNVFLSHEIGKAKIVKFLNGWTVDFNHSPLRDYYYVRNLISVGRKHNRRLRCIKWMLKKVYLVNRYETNRRNKDKMMFLGACDGLRNKLGRCQYSNCE